MTGHPEVFPNRKDVAGQSSSPEKPDNSLNAVTRPAQQGAGGLLAAEPIPMDFETFASLRGGSMSDVGDAGAHKRGRRQSNKQWNRIIKAIDARSALVLARRCTAREEYDEAVSRGELRPLTRLERLKATASGHPDNPSVQAAKRLLSALKVPQ